MLKNKKRDGEMSRIEEFGAELSPDDLDLREDNDLTKEQKNNSRTENLKNKYNSKEGNK